MKRDLLRLDLSVVVDLGTELPEGFLGIADAVTRTLVDWSDGRYVYASELVRDGLERVVGEAVHRAVRNMLYARYGGEMVTGFRSRMSRAGLEEMKILKDLKPVISGDDFFSCRSASFVSGDVEDVEDVKGGREEAT